MESMFTIRVDDVLYEVPRDKLEAQSDYFKALFNSNMIELENNQVDLSESVSNDIIKIVVDFIEMDERPADLTRENICDVLNISQYLQIGSLREHCCRYVKEQLAILPTEDMLEMIADYSLTDIRDYYLDRIEDDFRLISKSTPYSLNAERLVFLRSDLDAACKLLSSSRLHNLSSEMDVLAAALAWQNYLACDNTSIDNTSLRLSYEKPRECMEITNCVRAALIQPTSMQKLMAEHGVQWEDAVEKGIQGLECPLPYWMVPIWQAFIHYHHSKWPRELLDCGAADIRTRGAAYGDIDNDTLTLSRPSCGTIRCARMWNSLKNVVCTADDFVYVENEEAGVRCFYRWDARHYYTWKRLSSPVHDAMITGAGLAHSGRDGGLYSVAGKDVCSATNTKQVWRYEADKDLWRTVSPLPESLVYPGVTVHLNTGNLYVSGGSGADGHMTRKFYCLTGGAEGRGTWIRLPDMLSARRKHALISFQDYIYAVGSQHCEVDRYSIKTGIWSNVEGARHFTTNFTNVALVAYNHIDKRIQYSDYRYMYSINLEEENVMEVKECESNIRQRLIICRCPVYTNTIYTDEDNDLLNNIYEF